MGMAMRRWAPILIAAGALLIGGRLVRRVPSLHAATTTLVPAQSYLIILGMGDTTGANWDGSLSVTGAAVQILRGWRFAGADSISGFRPEAAVSKSRANSRDAAIAAAPNGEVAISRDTYDKGDYDVYLRRVRFDSPIAMDDPIPIAATAAFEARSSLAYDAQNRLWIAYEVAGSRWGKDFGALDTTGLPRESFRSPDPPVFSVRLWGTAPFQSVVVPRT